MAAYLAEVIGFFLVIGFVSRKVWPVLKRLMDSQAESIRSSLVSSDSALEAGKRMLEEARAALEVAHSEATKIIELAHETSAQLRLEGERRGREEYERLVAAATAETAFERQRAQAEVTRQIGAMVMAATERVVAAEIDTTLQRTFISETIDVAEAMV